MDIRLNEKNKNKIILVCILSFLFVIYFAIGYILSYKIDSNKYFDFFFSSDIPRVWEDIANLYGNHYRTKVHPFFPILIYPMFQFLKGVVIDDKLTFVVLYSLIGTLNCFLFYKIIEKFTLFKYKKYLYTIVYGLSFSSLIFSSLAETYLIAATFLLLLWYYAIDISVSDKKLTNKDYILLAILGVFCYGITVTNFVQFIIAGLYIFVTRNRKIKDSIQDLSKIVIGIAIAVILLTILQNFIFPNITTFWEVLSGKVENEETLYMNFSFSLIKIIKNAMIFFVYSIIARNINANDYMLYLRDVNFQIYFIFAFVLMKMLVSSYINRKNRILPYLWLAIIFNFTLHNIYGSDDVFLFSQHYIFLIVIVLALDANVIVNNNKYFKLYTVISDILLLLLVLYCNFKGIVKVANQAQYKFGFIFFNIADVFKITGFIFLILVASYVLLFVNRKTKYILAIIILFTLQLFSIKASRVSKEAKVNENLDGITFSLENFDKQIIYFDNSIFIANRYIPIKTNYRGRLYKMNNVIYAEGEDGENENKGYSFKLYSKNNSLYIKDYSGERLVYDLKESYVNDFFIFGMGRRDKYILYKDYNTKLYNLYNFTSKFDLYKGVEITGIDPINYKAHGSYLGKEFSIVEDEDAIRITVDDETKLYGDNVHINIPKFSGGGYTDMLRILFNEVMVNISSKGPIPSLINYKEPFYRDAAIVAMFLKKTNNIDQIKPWIESINTMYDMQRVIVAEPDNLGQVLYLQSFLDEPNEELISKILEEAERISTEDGMLRGTTDWANLSIYQTAWLKFGLSSLGLDYSKWKLADGVRDAYADTMWFYNLDDKDKLHNRDGKDVYHYDSAWQYLNYARAHFYNYDLSYIDRYNNEYPMSYEIGALKEELSKISPNMYRLKASAPHIWAAAEMYLYYIDR